MRNKNSKFSDPNKFETCCGSDDAIIYDPILNADGTVSLIPSGKESISQKINSFKEQCDISYIIKRLEVGDTTVLNQAKAMYGDFTDMPKTMAEALQLHINAEKMFDRLPVEVKQKFNNSFNKWFMSFGSDEWKTLMTIEKGENAASLAPKEAGEPLVGSENV